MNCADKISHTLRPLDYQKFCVEEILKYALVVKDAGINNINFNIKMIDKMPVQNKKSVAKTLKEHFDKMNLRVRVAHAVYEDMLVFPYADENVLKQKIIESILITKILGANQMVVHAGISYKDNVYDGEKTIADNVNFFNEICLIAKNEDITICIENNVVLDTFCKDNIFKPNIKTCNKIALKLGKLTGAKVKLCYDIGHANVSAENLVDDLFSVVKNIEVFHIHNNLGNVNYLLGWKNDVHNPCFNGNINYIEFFKNLQKTHFFGEIVIESVYKSSGEDLKNDIKKDYEFIKKNIKNL